MTKKYREPQVIKDEIYLLLKSYKDLLGGFDNPKYLELKKEKEESEIFHKNNNMFLAIEAQNIVHRKLNKMQPLIVELIEPIFGEKYENMDGSVNHKFKNYFDAFEGTKTIERKNYKYRINTSVSRSYTLFRLFVSVHIWNDNGQQSFSKDKAIAVFENQTSFKSVEPIEKLPTYSVKAEVKKLQRYEAAKAKLEGLRTGLNDDFMRKFSPQHNNTTF